MPRAIPAPVRTRHRARRFAIVLPWLVVTMEAIAWLAILASAAVILAI